MSTKLARAYPLPPKHELDKLRKCDAVCDDLFGLYSTHAIWMSVYRFLDEHDIDGYTPGERDAMIDRCYNFVARTAFN